MSNHADHKKQKKLAQLLHNKRIQAINLQEDQHARGRELEKEREEEVKAASRTSSRSAAAAKRAEGTPVWSAKLQELRDKNTGQKRMATERWNRFAGTESGGGRGL